MLTFQRKLEKKEIRVSNFRIPLLFNVDNVIQISLNRYTYLTKDRAS